jgi:hypothetical protein
MQAQPAIPPRVDLVVQQPPAPPRDHWDVVGTVAWPLAATFIVFLLRRAIGDALKGLAARAKKLSVGVVAVELAESTARSWGGAALDEIRDATLAQVGDSSSALVTSLSDPTPADYAVIDLGNGDAWLTSRLFAVATIVARLRAFALSPSPSRMRWARDCWGPPRSRRSARSARDIRGSISPMRKHGPRRSTA